MKRQKSEIRAPFSVKTIIKMLVGIHLVQRTLRWWAPCPVQGWEWSWWVPLSSTFLPFWKKWCNTCYFHHQEFASLLPNYRNLSHRHYTPASQTHHPTISGPLGTSSSTDLNTSIFCKQSLTYCSSDAGCTSPFQAVLTCTQASNQVLLIKTQVTKNTFITLAFSSYQWTNTLAEFPCTTKVTTC